MKSVDIVHAVAGTMVLIFTTLGLIWTPWAFVVTFFIGANLLQFGFTKWCILQQILNKLGIE